MRLEIHPYSSEFLDDAAGLLAQRHAAHRVDEPALPAAYEQLDVARGAIEKLTTENASGAVATRGGEVVGYVLGTPRADLTWGPNVWVEPAGHAARVAEDVRDLYGLAAGSVCFEFASVNYNAMLTQVSTPATVGKVSGFGWGMGYVGGIVLLVFLYFGLIQPTVGLFGVSSEDGLDVRVAMLFAGAWFGLFAIPVLLAVPVNPVSSPKSGRPRIGILASYAELGRDVAQLWRTQRNTVRFLIASAVFRDGLASAFTFGGILASTVFGFSPGEVIVFAVVSNIVAGAATIAVGALILSTSCDSNTSGHFHTFERALRYVYHRRRPM